MISYTDFMEISGQVSEKCRYSVSVCVHWSFYRQNEIAGYGMSVHDHRIVWWWRKGVMDRQISYMTLVGVHSTMHLLMSCNYYVCVCNIIITSLCAITWFFFICTGSAAVLYSDYCKGSSQWLHDKVFNVTKCQSFYLYIPMSVLCCIQVFL